jgi:hypothetical protein
MNRNTGRILHHDERSRQYAYAAPQTAPKSIVHRLHAGALDQGYLSACTGFAGAQWLNCAINLPARKRWNKRYTGIGAGYLFSSDARRLYGAATQYDDFGWVWPPTDQGSSGLGVAKALKKQGVISRYEWTFDFDGFLAALQRQPVLVGTAWTDGMCYPSPSGVIHVHTDTLDGAGGHEYLAIGINYRRKLIRIRNSWGPRWGIAGDAYISFDDMKMLLAADGDVMVPVI